MPFKYIWIIGTYFIPDSN